ncbi:MAG: glycosyltransferase [Hyphomicrobiaceae bacterium]|nr:glycosyltransferase [Hyphomicrobiaceae bacterium]
MTSVLYLVNQYPHNNHTFIRREILALERLGMQVGRVSVRKASEAFVNEIDLLEANKTLTILDLGSATLCGAFVREIATNFAAASRAALLAYSMWRRSGKSFVKHAAYFVEACWLAGYLHRTEFTHLHAHFGTNTADVATLVHVLRGVPYSLTIHGYDEFDEPQSKALDVKVRLAAFIVAVSEFTKSQLMRWVSHEDWHKIFVIHCGLEPTFFAASFSRIAPPKFVAVGRICREKGQLLLLEAASELRKQGIAVDLTIIGDGPLREEVERRIVEGGLSDQVRLTGWLSSDDVKTHVLQSRALVHASCAEGLPVVLMEAMALKRPVIATYIAGIPELVVDGKSGWLVPAGSVDALAFAMADCLRQRPASLARMGEVGRRAVMKRHHSDKEAGKLARLFVNPNPLIDHQSPEPILQSQTAV